MVSPTITLTSPGFSDGSTNTLTTAGATFATGEGAGEGDTASGVAADAEVSGHQVADDTGLSPGEVDRAARELRDEGLIDPYFEGGGGFSVMAVSGDARRIVGAWPTAETFAYKLLEAVERGLRAATTTVSGAGGRSSETG